MEKYGFNFIEHEKSEEKNTKMRFKSMRFKIYVTIAF